MYSVRKCRLKEDDMMLENWLKLFKAEGKEIKYIRASTLGHYWFCAIQAWLQAQGIESPSNEALQVGKRIHDEISNARTLSQWESQFEAYIKSFMVDHPYAEGSTGFKTEQGKVFARAWYDGETIIGHVTTHGVDDFRVSPEREVIIVEYKTTNQRVIDYYKLMPAIFQVKVYAWILEPYLKAGGYKFKNGEIVFLTRNGNPLGRKEIVDYDATQVETEVARILSQFRNPDTLIPPAKWKCLNCPQIFKEKCPLAKKEEPKI